MPVVHHGHKLINLKIVYYGPGLGGKTTNLRHIHAEARPDQRGRLLSLNTESERTLFFDLLPVALGEYRGFGVRLHLCTVPGQIAYDKTRQLVLRNVDGVVFVADSQELCLDSNVVSIANLEANLALLGEDARRMPLVVQYNKRDAPSALPVSQLRRLLSIAPGVPEVEAVACEGVGVIDTMKRIVKACLQVMGDPSKAPEGRTRSVIDASDTHLFADGRPVGREVLSGEPGLPLAKVAVPQATSSAVTGAPESSRPELLTRSA